MDNTELDRIVGDFADNPEHWIHIREVLEERIRLNEENNKANRALITMVEREIAEREQQAAKRN